MSYQGNSPFEWASESACRNWVVDQFLASNQAEPPRYGAPGVQLEVFSEVSLIDVYGNRARADICIEADGPDGNPVLLLVELKHQADILSNAVDAFVQAYQYVEFCTVVDDRLPGWLGRSPTMGFAGLFHASQRDDQRWSLQGAAATAFKLRVGSLHAGPDGSLAFLVPPSNNVLVQRNTYEMFNWRGNASNLVSGRIKRNGGKDRRVSIAETFSDAMNRLRTYEDLF